MDGGPGAVGPVLARTTRLASPGSGIMAIGPRVDGNGPSGAVPAQTRSAVGSVNGPRRDARQRARCADSGHSHSRHGTRKSDPERILDVAGFAPPSELPPGSSEGKIL